MAKTALLVIDMQMHFLDMTTTALPNVLTLSSFFRKHSLPQIFTQHGHSKAELTPPFKNQLVRKWGVDGSIHLGSEPWKLIPEIEKAWEAGGKEKIIAKNTYDAFMNTDLEDVLKGKGVERVVVVGVMTDCCVDTTGRSAFNRGYETWLVKDATGSANRTQHEAGLRGFGFAFGEVLTTKEVMARLENE
jgi:nicotinamidase-related amidase